MDVSMSEMQERIAHLEHQLDEMSAELARQGGEMAVMQRRVQLLMEREAAREADSGGGVVIGDERPPHY